MAEITNLNGAPISSSPKVHIVLEYDQHTGKLQLDGDLGNVDLCLNTLAQASRYLEAVYRFQQAQLMAQQAQEQMQVRSMLARPQ